MSIINIQDVTVLANPANFTDPYLFRITFECMAPLAEDLEWKLIYVGSAESESFDQELDTCMVGPVPVGVNSFEFEPLRSITSQVCIEAIGACVHHLSLFISAHHLQAAAPSPSRIPPSDLIGVTVILLTCAYAEQEFVRIGYYVNTEYGDAELKAQYDASLEEDALQKGSVAPDPTNNVDKMVRSVLSDKPRVTKFNIKWDLSLPSMPVSTSTFPSLGGPEQSSASVPPPFDPYAVKNPHV
ncbi:BZ3500_MvSof-1268-A1-R1_Chr12-2g03822 [Microbotryum saponariae]|uniref:Anti-silencing function protein 1 n=1 Tax=Microbotryum saponariae TaxID=289078 RepID=A0A2X0KRT3_9BASI|nr:BZ3500_MvSof-1268-A1-R1_Chr12-2g03822 [Microbotryum saponariae]